MYVMHAAQHKMSIKVNATLLIKIMKCRNTFNQKDVTWLMYDRTCRHRQLHAYRIRPSKGWGGPGGGNGGPVV